MQRDLDLLRQLLLEIERRGATSSIDALHADPRHEGDERVRYHLRLLTDGGFLKEVGQTSGGAPCVRLTYEGHEFVELARSDVRWREAKSTLLASTGGVPLALIRALLMKWACRSVARNERRRVTDGRRRVHRYVERIDPEVWLDAYATPDALWDDDQARLFRDREARRRRREVQQSWDLDLYGDVADVSSAEAASAPLPEHLL